MWTRLVFRLSIEELCGAAKGGRAAEVEATDMEGWMGMLLTMPFMPAGDGLKIPCRVVVVARRRFSAQRLDRISWFIDLIFPFLYSSSNKFPL